MTKIAQTDQSQKAPPPQFDASFFTELRRAVAHSVKEQMCALQDRKSFAAASPWLSQDEACEYLKISRTTIYAHRKRRKLAKSADMKDAAFAPEYGSGPDRKSTRLNSSHSGESRMPSSA